MENDAPNVWKARLKKSAIFLLKLLCLIYSLVYLWRTVKSLYGLLKAMGSMSNGAERFRVSMEGGRYASCASCGSQIPLRAKICPICNNPATQKGDAKGCFYCLFMLPINAAMTIITAIPTLLLLAMATGNMAAVDAAINGQLPQ